MLKIEIGNYGNVVIGKVLEQGEEIKRGSGLFFTASNGLEIKSNHSQNISSDTLWVKGLLYTNDNIPFYYECESSDEAIKLIEKVKIAVKEYNLSLKENSIRTTKINLEIVE